MEPEVTKRGALDMQVCVPESWTDEQVKEFADTHNFCGTTHGWAVRKQADYKIEAKERTPCHDRAGFVHIMLDA